MNKIEGAMLWVIWSLAMTAMGLAFAHGERERAYSLASTEILVRACADADSGWRCEVRP